MKYKVKEAQVVREYRRALRGLDTMIERDRQRSEGERSEFSELNLRVRQYLIRVRENPMVLATPTNMNGERYRPPGRTPRCARPKNRVEPVLGLGDAAE